MMHVRQPFSYSIDIGSFEISGYVLAVRLCQGMEVAAVGQFLHQMENCPQQLGEGLVLKEILVPKQS